MRLSRRCQRCRQRSADLPRCPAADADSIGFGARTGTRIGNVHVIAAGGVAVAGVLSVEDVIRARGIAVAGEEAGKSIVLAGGIAVAGFVAIKGVVGTTDIAEAGAIAEERIRSAGGITVAGVVARECVVDTSGIVPAPIPRYKPLLAMLSTALPLML